MNRLTAIALAVTLGLPSGYFARGVLQPPVDRVASAFALIDAYCKPLFQRREVQVGAEMVQLPYTVVVEHWAEPHSQIIMELNQFSCEISDSLAHFTMEERAKFEALARAYTEKEFPALAPDEPIGVDQWDLFALWSNKYSKNDPRRRGVILARYQQDGPDAGTFMSVNWSAE